MLYLSNLPGISRDTQRARLHALRDLNQSHLAETGDSEIGARINGLATNSQALQQRAAFPFRIEQPNLCAHAGRVGLPVVPNSRTASQARAASVKDRQRKTVRLRLAIAKLKTGPQLIGTGCQFHRLIESEFVGRHGHEVL